MTVGERNIIVNVERMAGYLAERDRTIAAQEERIRQLEAALREHQFWLAGRVLDAHLPPDAALNRAYESARALLAEQPTDGGTGCQHSFDESVIEGTPTGGVVCRKCGVEGAVYR